jgi:hypothetical protein
VVPVFLFRHYVTDRGQFPPDMWKDLLLPGQTCSGPKRAGVLPYLALAGRRGGDAPRLRHLLGLKIAGPD